MNELTALLAQIRHHYLGALISSYEEFKKLHQPSSPEVMLQLERDGALAYKLYRVDMASNSAAGPLMQDVVPTTYLNFESKSFEPLDELQVTVSPFYWSNLEISADSALRDSDLEEWALLWLDVSDCHIHDTNGLQNVIHSLERPQGNESASKFTVDMGSAPPQAIEDLMTLLRLLGARKVALSSPEPM